jgi:hypothetical protein
VPLVVGPPTVLETVGSFVPSPLGGVVLLAVESVLVPAFPPDPPPLVVESVFAEVAPEVVPVEPSGVVKSGSSVGAATDESSDAVDVGVAAASVSG